jgi:hypothetical protein
VRPRVSYVFIMHMFSARFRRFRGPGIADASDAGAGNAGDGCPKI